MTRHLPRHLMVSMLALLLALQFVPAASAQDTPHADTLRVGITGFENNLTPFALTFAALPSTNDLIHLVHDSLFWSQTLAEPEPWLAESAETDDEGLTWTVKLRDGVTWHDGEAFTAEDVAFSFDYYLEQAGSSGRYAHHVFDVPDFANSEVIDDLTVVLTFNSPAPQFKIMPGADLPILPEHIYSSIDDPAARAAELPVGTGPFELIEIVADQSYTLVANENYFKGVPTVDRLELVVINDPASAYTSLRTGDVHMVDRIVPPELVDQFRDDADVTVLEGTRNESSQLYFNARSDVLGDPVLRKAITMSFDLDDLVETVLLGNARPGRDTYLHPDSPWAVPDAGHAFDVDAANTMLDDAGYPMGDDGMRTTAEGEPLDFTILVNSFAPTDIRAAQILAEQALAVGVTLTGEPLEPAALRARRQAPEGGIPDYDAYISTLESHAHVDPDALYYFFHSPGPKGFGGAITGYSNPDYDALVEEASTANNADRVGLLASAQELLAEEAPVQVLWYPDGLYAFLPAVYDGWVSDTGQGVFTKRSFLPEYATAAAAGRQGAGEATSEPTATDEMTADETATATSEPVAVDPAADDGGGSSGAIIAIVLVALLAIGGALMVGRRGRSASDDEM